MSRPAVERRVVAAAAATAGGGGGEVLAPFYAPPPRKTSAQIIREARASLGGAGLLGGAGVQRAGVRTVQTKRPFTPRERERTLFSGGASRGERPPSSFT